MVAPEPPPVSGNALAVLKAIVAEVAGTEPPFSADSYLPPHLVHDACRAIESATSDDADVRQAYEAILLARLAKANAIITELRAEIDGMRRPQIPGQPPGAMFGPGMAAPNPLVFDPAGRFADPSRFTAYARQECDV